MRHRSHLPRLRVHRRAAAGNPAAMALEFRHHADETEELDLIGELQITAERVERFRLMHEDAVRDLRQKVAQARAEGYAHRDIDQAIRRARDSVGRFTRLPTAE